MDTKNGTISCDLLIKACVRHSTCHFKYYSHCCSYSCFLPQTSERCRRTGKLKPRRPKPDNWAREAQGQIPGPSFRKILTHTFYFSEYSVGRSNSLLVAVANLITQLNLSSQTSRFWNNSILGQVVHRKEYLSCPTRFHFLILHPITL